MSTKYVFILRDIDLDSIHSKYGIDIPKHKNFTNISDLSTTDNNTITFLGESKKNHSCMVSMSDVITGDTVDEIKSVCFWCTEPFSWNGIGCPIAYNDAQLTKTYYSSINKNTYTIKENVSQKYSKKIKSKPGSYLTDGVFCSFECAQAWINYHKHLRQYDMSSTLLLKLYKDITGKTQTKIIPAPERRVLKKYGGTETIEQYRDNFGKVDYEKHGNIVSGVVNIKKIGTLYEKNFNF